MQWSPGQPWPGPRRARAIVALWGVVPGKGALADNTVLALAAQDLALQLGAERVLHCSSAAVYAPAPAPQAEEAANPQSDYGHAKLAMEQALQDWAGEHPEGPAFCAMRIGNVAGADSAFAAIARGGPVTMDRFADGGGPRRSYLSHAMLAQAVDALLSCPLSSLPRVVNLADRGVIDMADLVRAAGRALLWNDTGRTGSTITLDLACLSRLTPPLAADITRLLADGAFLAGENP
ncbi:NAD-dependent epimerase/dehydratase family protein [Lutimaribacter sp. EGI FJ00013]|uniref:NAD-dependent epimerase/dehydratase family protein n=1 Tax=Lutimaribacter degradans TaxID=2945989 RepID=A0ACC5ZUH6_9RHOB|nr:NAD-dependent epimerase/dehydratase family protein [Lutimaribacter sp. EGI FJ00013]